MVQINTWHPDQKRAKLVAVVFTPIHFCEEQCVLSYYLTVTECSILIPGSQTVRNSRMTKDLFIIDTRCHLNVAVKKAFEKNGYEVEVSPQDWKIFWKVLFDLVRFHRLPPHRSLLAKGPF